MNFLMLLSLLPFCATLAYQSAPEIEIEQGRLRGKFRKARTGREFSAFTGIPYAKPPVGELRFKPPIAATPWNGVLDATKPHAECPQMNTFINDFTVRGDEDCLFLNVYTPQLPVDNKQLLPVMYYIHGGGWRWGTSGVQLYGPDVLLSKDIVLVTANYRLGVLGFLSTLDEVVPGNNALKDQNLALKWIKKNIAKFGGDPDRITIFGQSAGAASIHYHVLSPLSKDLINGAIIQSGSAVSLWALSSNNTVVNNNRLLAEFLGCPDAPNKEFVDCLMKVDAYTIVKQEPKFSIFSYDPAIIFSAVIEPNLEGAFLTESAVDIIKSGKTAGVPLILGLTEDEGGFKSSHLYSDDNLISQLDKDLHRIAPITWLYSESDVDKNKTTDSIRKFYFNDGRIDHNVKSALTNVYSDAWFLSGLDTSVRLHVKYSKHPVYYFLFGYRGSNSFTPSFGDSSYDYGVSHCDELLYLFDIGFFNYTLNAEDREMIEIMTTLWSNFAETGNPTPHINEKIKTKWEPVKSDALEYYHIKKSTEMKMDENMYPERAKFWRNIHFGDMWHKVKDEL